MPFPTNLDTGLKADSIPTVQLSATLLGDATINHPLEHQAIETNIDLALAKIGIDNSAVDTSLDYFARQHLHQGTIGSWTDSSLDHALTAMWSNIQGGTTDQYFHITQAEHTAITGTIFQ